MLMNEKLKIWNPSISWEEAEKTWEEGAKRAHRMQPIKKLSSLPRMPGIAERGFLKYKSLHYLISHDSTKIFSRYIFKHPIKYALKWISSVLRKKSYVRDGDFFFYNVRDVIEFKKTISLKAYMRKKGACI